ncbi:MULTISPECIES: gliding motility-associated ABC transporter substrate-binding protein GldG [unclassified Myroides]|uniref:gliding motility-associated ABC transporter substrate-binding protein GldG n=1 Tax=unclassified Myroides TaxID=2642485 RepID=UPI0015FB093C|nr:MULTISPECIES: gliding motility-associated ABC transporter substrate-binding protein GldG [unclassified Myroides]MBB1150135.1 gliding motility-associated ABC transporter substrate-binding protein GldG [Myroides sp. NP-2]MDM1408368.1 gliding motility-associated ABC transporter substrate-binding protein GldG [Myroides sp. DF42-4-2]
MKRETKKNIVQLGIFIAGIVLLNAIGAYVYHRFDLTQDKRYTLSPITNDIIDQVTEPILIEVLLEGQFSQEFVKLQGETRQLLEEFSAENPNILFRFVNPLEEGGATEDQIVSNLYELGAKPVTLTVNNKGIQSQALVFPWAFVSKGEQMVKVQLLKNMIGANTEEKVLTSIQHLEYAFTEAIAKVNLPKSKKIAILKGNGQLEDPYLADFLISAKDNYHLAPFTLDSVAQSPQATLAQLQEFDLAIMAKPTKEFDEKQIEVLDQFIMNGGKTLWLLDQVQADFDSLRAKGSLFAYPKDQSLGEMLFKYGVRINPLLVKDEVATPIKLALGRQGSETQYGEFIWKFAPFVYPESTHPIVKNIEGVRLDFVSPIDTLKNDIKKTVLLQSSAYSLTVGTPTEINLNMINEETSPEHYKNKGNYILGVLLEGQFKSVFENRILPFALPNAKKRSEETKMIVISDGDIIKNQLDQNYQPMELGYDKWTNKLYGNKEFLFNAVNYLLDDSGLINLRTKEVKIPVLDKMRVFERYSTIQIIVLGIPILVVLLIGFLFSFFKRKAFVKK